ncbi:MAG: hypothetical protein ACRDSE_00735 [Pseudonocardiaceae bacterium]
MNAFSVARHYGVPSGLRADEMVLAAVNTAHSSVFCLLYVAMRDWGLVHLLPDAERVAVELVARAVETTGIADQPPRWSDIEQLATISVRVSVEPGDVLLIQVRDCDPTCPIPPNGSYLDRHLKAVYDRSDRFYWYPVDDGKVIWAELSLRRTPHPGVLPRRASGSFSWPRPENPVTALQDLDVMTKVLDGLRRLNTMGGAR